MTVDDLREALAGVDGHLPVVIEQPADGSGGGADAEYHLTLEAKQSAFPTVGRMLVVVPVGQLDNGADIPQRTQAPDASRDRYAALMQSVERLLNDGHMDQEHLARLRAAWEGAQ